MPAVTAARRAVDIITSDKVRTIALYVAIAIWVTYRMLCKSYFGVFFVESHVFTGDFIRHRVLLLVALSVSPSMVADDESVPNDLNEVSLIFQLFEAVAVAVVEELELLEELEELEELELLEELPDEGH